MAVLLTAAMLYTAAFLYDTLMDALLVTVTPQQTHLGLMLPTQAVRADPEGGQYVYILEAGRVKKRVLKIRSANSARVCVQADTAGGLRPGDTVILSSPKRLREDMLY